MPKIKDWTPKRPYEHRPPPLRKNYGPCCACGIAFTDEGTEGRAVYLLALHVPAPIPGTGWGCIECGLPPDGGLALICQGCYEVNALPLYLIEGPLGSWKRKEVHPLSALFRWTALEHKPGPHWAVYYTGHGFFMNPLEAEN